MKADINNLRWARIFTSAHIPVFLVEQIADRDFETEAFLKYVEGNISTSNNLELEQFKLNPLFHVWSLVDTKNIIQGFLWFVIDPLTLDLVIQTFSVSSLYWNIGIVGKLSEFMKNFRNHFKLNKIFWITNRPKHSEKHGFARSKHILMEYDDESFKEGKEVKDGENINGEHG